MLLKNSKFLLIVCLLTTSCSIRHISFTKNVKKQGYVLNTTQDLLFENKIVSPSPKIEYYFVQNKFISYKDDKIQFKHKPKFYAINICDLAIKEYLSMNGDTLFYKADNNGIINYSIITKTVVIIKKKVKKSNQFKYYNLKGYEIMLNGKDTLKINMNFHFSLVDVISNNSTYNYGLTK